MLTPEAAADVVEIRQLQARYGDVVSRRAWSELDALFAPDATVTLDLRTRAPIELVGPRAVGAFIAGAVERFDHFQLALLDAVVDLTGDRTAVGRMYTWELRHEPGAGWSHAYGVYDDRFERRRDTWVFVERRYRSVARTDGETTEVLGVPPLPWS